MSVNQKILQVMKDLKKIDPSQMEFGRTKYSYLSENAMTPAIKDLFEANGLVICPVQVQPVLHFLNSKNSKGEDEVDILATVTVTYQISDAETGESLNAVGVGSGMDRGDKSVPKACTAALKQMFRHLLLIASPDRLDPDNTASDALRAPKSTAPSVATDVVKFGKYAGKTLNEIFAMDAKYVEWVAGKEGEFQKAAQELLKEKSAAEAK